MQGDSETSLATYLRRNITFKIKKKSKSQKTDMFKFFENYRFFGQNFVP